MTPKELGYRYPAEWERHAATWLAWPHRVKTWPGKFEPIPQFFAQFVRTLANYEPVNILAGDPILAEARALVGDIPHVTLYAVPTNDVWARDHGPLFLEGKPGQQPALIDWDFNAWGGKYPPWDFDNQVPARIATLQGRLRFTPGMVFEGGSIDGNAEGTFLTTKQCLLNPNRNPNLSQTQIEQILAEQIGANKVIWLDGEILGDDTDGHVDELARFVNPTTVVAAMEYDSQDANYQSLQANFRQLQAETNCQEQALEVIALPLPKPVYFEEKRLPASYCNFYIANGVVLVPQFDDPADREALSILRRLFPDRDVVGLFARDLVLGKGAFHCITQQEAWATSTATRQ